MKTSLSLLAVIFGCAGCAGVQLPADLAGTNIKGFNVGTAYNNAAKVTKVVESQRDLTEAEEIAIGESVASNVLGAAPLLQDKKLQRYVQQVGMVLAARTERPNLAWHFAVLDDNTFNAFATPGGYIFITRGLLLSLRNEAELAGVLAHEIAHVLRKHHLEAMKKEALKASAGEAASYFAEKNPQLTKGGKLTPALNAMANIGTGMILRGLDKKDEFEADRMGVVIAARAGYDPYGLPAVLQSLQTVNPNFAGLALMFKTHPSFQSRLDLLAGLMDAPFEKFETQPTVEARFKSQVQVPVVKAVKK
jgi:beta-barrel assembly-enhancing protease